MEKDIVEEANEVVKKRMASFTRDIEGLGFYQGHYDGFGFAHEAICPDRDCRYYKYAGFRLDPVCTHPDVFFKVAIGGVYSCPKIFLERWAERILKLLRRNQQ